MKVKLTKARNSPTGPLPEGHEIEGPEAWRLVELGFAVPIDEEATKKIEGRKKMREAKAKGNPPSPASPQIPMETLADATAQD